MTDADSSTHVDDDELILRRIPKSTGWYDPRNGTISQVAFRPRPDDDTGLSVTRAKSDAHPDFLTPAEDAAIGSNASGYYVAVLRAGDLRKHGIDVAAKPLLPENPGHAELPLLTFATRKSSEAINATSLIAEKLTIRVEGPFPPNPTSNQDHEGM